ASVPIDSVALFETNSKDETFTFGLNGIGVMTVLGAYVGLVCLADPKSCFGSCPTFYVEGADSARDAGGEAFAPIPGDAREVALHMRNEAWETHMVRSVHLLAAPKPAHGR